MSRISYSTTRCSVNVMNWTERLLFPQPPLLSCQHTPVTLGLLHNCINKWTLETCTTEQEHPLQEPQASRRPAETEGRDINEFSSRGVVCTFISLERKGFIRINEMWGSSSSSWDALPPFWTSSSRPRDSSPSAPPETPRIHHALPPQGYLTGGVGHRTYQSTRCPLRGASICTLREIPKITLLLNYSVVMYAHSINWKES